MQRIKRKIEELRQQPEPVRLRAATVLTAACGVVLVVLWVAVLLPLQLHFNRGEGTDEASQARTSPVVSPSAALAVPQGTGLENVAGTRDTSRPAPLPSAELLVSPRLATPSPSPVENSVPVQVQP